MSGMLHRPAVMARRAAAILLVPLLASVPLALAPASTAQADPPATTNTITVSQGWSDLEGTARYIPGGTTGEIDEARKLVNRRYKVRLGLPGCQSGMRYHWFIRAEAPDGGLGLTAATTGCDPAVIDGVPKGSHEVTVKRFDGSHTNVVSAATIKVGAAVVVTMGDSYAAGDGLPPFAHLSCKRTRNSLQYATAVAASTGADGQVVRPVVDMHLACSGASAKEFFVDHRDKNGNVINEPQLAQLQRIIDGLGQPDAIMLQLGGNDMAYVDHISACGRIRAKLFRVCLSGGLGEPEKKITADIEASLARAVATTEGNLATLAGCLHAGKSGKVITRDFGLNDTASETVHDVACPMTAPVPRDRVLTTGYGDGFTGPTGYCGSTLDVPIGNMLFNINPAQSEWLGARLLKPLVDLNDRFSAAAGWKHVRTYEAFSGHGVCAPDPWIFDLLGAGWAPELHSGSFHPTAAGVAEYARLAHPALRDIITGKVVAPGQPDPLALRSPYPQWLRICRDGDTVTATITAHDNAVDDGRTLQIRSASVAPVNVVLRAGQEVYERQVPGAAVDGMTLEVYDLDVVDPHWVLRAEVPTSGCTPPPPDDLGNPPSGPDAGALRGPRRGGAMGDPHLRTVDGARFSAQVLGEYVYLRPATPGVDEPVLHARHEKVTANGFATVITALGTRVAGRTVEVYTRGSTRFVLDGRDQNPPAKGVHFVDLGHDASLTITDRNQVVIRSPKLTVEARLVNPGTASSQIDLSLSDLPSDGSLVGLLGRPNHDAGDDLATPSGITLTQEFLRTGNAATWKLTDGWRLTKPADSLLKSTYAGFADANPTLSPTQGQLDGFLLDIEGEINKACAGNDGSVDYAWQMAVERFFGRSLDDTRSYYCRYRVNGKVVAADDPTAPLSGVTVRVTSPQLKECVTTSQADGSYSCETGPSPAGVASGALPVVTVTTRLPETTVDLGSVTVTANRASTGGTAGLSVTVPTQANTLRMTGRALTPDGKPAGDTGITALSGTQKRTLFTNPDDGSYAVSFVYPKGTPTASVKISGYDVGTRNADALDVPLADGTTRIRRDFTVNRPAAVLPSAAGVLVVPNGPSAGLALTTKFNMYNRTLRAHRPDGTLAFEFTTGGSYQLLPSPDGRTLYLRFEIGYWSPPGVIAFSLEPQTIGQQRWTYGVHTHKLAVGPAGHLWAYTGTGDERRITALDPATGAVRADVKVNDQPGGFALGSLVVDPQGGVLTAFAGSTDQSRAVLSLAADGTQRWRRNLWWSNAGGGDDLVVAGGLVFFQTGSGTRYHSLRLADGADGWFTGPAAGRQFYGLPAAATVGGVDRVYSLAYVTAESRYHVEARAADTGQVLWDAPLTGQNSLLGPDVSGHWDAVRLGYCVGYRPIPYVFKPAPRFAAPCRIDPAGRVHVVVNQPDANYGNATVGVVNTDGTLAWKAKEKNWASLLPFAADGAQQLNVQLHNPYGPSDNTLVIRAPDGAVQWRYTQLLNGLMGVEHVGAVHYVHADQGDNYSKLVLLRW